MKKVGMLAVMAILGFAQVATASFSEVMIGQWRMEYRINSSFVSVYNMDAIGDEKNSEGEFFITGTGEYDDPVTGAFFPSINAFVLFDPGTVIDRVFVIVFEDGNVIGSLYLHYSHVHQAWSTIYGLDFYAINRLPENLPEAYTGGDDDIIQVLKQRVAALEDTILVSQKNDVVSMGIEMDGDDYIAIGFREDYSPMTEREHFNEIAADWLLGGWFELTSEFYGYMWP